MAVAIEFENVSKQYRLGLVSTKTLSHDIRRFWITNIMGKEDPYLRIGETNDRASKGSSEYVWALRDINFNIEQGDVVGIIGKNGAGKSTLLKLLSRVTGPTTGTIRAHGRIGSLLEVGTGFHGEMTGRENIFMNGAILGMSRSEIQAKLDEIIDFSGCERYIDTPVKRYSSGMTVRLGFAVAAFLEPEILVVDEVLAVGDAEFQKKAIGKMKDVSQGQGRTVLFVSHNMGSITKLCTNGIVLDKGQISYMGTAVDCVREYIGSNNKGLCQYAEITDAHRNYEYTGKEIELISVSLEGDVGEYATNQPLEFDVKMKKNKGSVDNATLEIMFNDQSDYRLGSYISKPIDLRSVKEGEEFTVHTVIRDHNLAKGNYRVCFQIGQKDVMVGVKDYDIVHNVLSFEIVYNDMIQKDRIMYWPARWGSNHFQGASELMKM